VSGLFCKCTKNPGLQITEVYWQFDRARVRISVTAGSNCVYDSHCDTALSTGCTRIYCSAWVDSAKYIRLSLPSSCHLRKYSLYSYPLLTKTTILCTLFVTYLLFVNYLHVNFCSYSRREVTKVKKADSLISQDGRRSQECRGM